MNPDAAQRVRADVERAAACDSWAGAVIELRRALAIAERLAAPRTPATPR